MCKEIIDQQSEMDPSASAISVAAVFKGIEVFAANFANENVDPGILRELKKIRRVNFTVRHVHSDVFKISQPAGIAKVRQWQDAGVIERIGSVKETKGSKPSNLFSLTNPLIGKYMFGELSASEFLTNKLRVCACKALLIRDWDRPSDGSCQHCDATWQAPKATKPKA